MLRSAQYRLQVLLRRGRNRPDAKGGDKEAENCRADEGRQGRPKPDVLDAEREQGQKDGGGFLLIPRDDHGERQLVHAAVEGFGQGQRDLNG